MFKHDMLMYNLLICYRHGFFLVPFYFKQVKGKQGEKHVVVHFVLLVLKTRGLFKISMVERWKVDIETLPQPYQTLLIKVPICRGSQSIE
jgi:hypothetical protein